MARPLGFFLRQRPSADIHQILKAGFGDGIEQGFTALVVMQRVDAVCAFPQFGGGRCSSMALKAGSISRWSMRLNA